MRSHGRRKVVSTVFSKQGIPEASLFSAPVTADRIRAALSGEMTESVGRKVGIGTLAIVMNERGGGVEVCLLSLKIE